MTRLRLPLLLVLLVAAARPAAPALSHGSRTAVDSLRHAVEREIHLKGSATVPKDHGCEIHDIACGETVSTNLRNDACQLADESFVDFYHFSGLDGETVTIDMTSVAFDTFLLLLNPDSEVVAADDNSAGGTDSRIVYTLDRNSSQWSVAANTLAPTSTGPYTLSLECSDSIPPPPPPPPPSDGFFSDPSYPDFRFRVSIGPVGDTRPGNREPSCQPETVCVSGALLGRSEIFIRILGPRPNGFLWPTLVRFTPSRVEVDILQASTGQVNTYTLPAVPPGVDELSGLQDRTGFLP